MRVDVEVATCRRPGVGKAVFVGAQGGERVRQKLADLFGTSDV
jgi:hypothetical protein